MITEFNTASPAPNGGSANSGSGSGAIIFVAFLAIGVFLLYQHFNKKEEEPQRPQAPDQQTQ